MDAAEALADLKQISSQIDRVVLCTHDGAVEASTLTDAAAASRMARAACDLYAAADAARATLDRPPLSQVEVATPAGSVFAIRDDSRLICALTGADPTVGLIFYDLKTCLRSLAEDPLADVVDTTPEDDDGGT
jgi:predicted regulator of Ras-like GTPase activity (Roadblock/LC7/MglB family)